MNWNVAMNIKESFDMTKEAQEHEAEVKRSKLVPDAWYVEARGQEFHRVGEWNQYLEASIQKGTLPESARFYCVR